MLMTLVRGHQEGVHQCGLGLMVVMIISLIPSTCAVCKRQATRGGLHCAQKETSSMSNQWRWNDAEIPNENPKVRYLGSRRGCRERIDGCSTGSIHHTKLVITFMLIDCWKLH